MKINTSPVARIILLDDHPVTLAGLEHIINAQNTLEVVASLRKPDALLQGRLEADLLILDILQGNQDGLALLRAINTHYPDLPILVLSCCTEKTYALRAVRGGARGYLAKEEPVEKIIEAIRTVLEGGTYRREELRTKESESECADSPVDNLTDRELAVFGLIGDGSGTKEIASNLGISVKTVESHRENIKRKLGIARIDKLISEAARWRVLSGSGKHSFTLA